MLVRRVALGFVLLACVALSAAAQKDKAPPKAKTYKTPQEVFDAFLVALNKRDSKTFVGCLAPETLTEMAGFYAMQGVQRRELVESTKKDDGKNDKLAKSWKPTLEVLDKHGLTVKATAAIKLGKTDAERAKAQAALVALVKDKAAFLIDYEEARDRDAPKRKDDDVKATLTDVKIDGDKATAMAVVAIAEKDKKGATEKRPLAFVKVGDCWKINPHPPETGKK